MTVMRWNQEYETGDKTVDLQHMRLFALVNELHESIDAGGDRDVVDEVLIELMYYVRSHFADEEALMERHRFGAIEDHRARHRELTDDVERMAADSESIDAERLCIFLYDWLVQHIMGWDMPMIAFVRADRAAE